MKGKSVLLWHKLVLWICLSMVLLGLGLMAANYFFMQRASQDIGIRGSEILGQQTDLYLSATVAGQADTIDLQLDQVRVVAEMGAASLANELSIFNTPLDSHLKELLSSSGVHATTVYYHSLEGQTYAYPKGIIRQRDRLQQSLDVTSFFLDFEDKRHLSVKWSPVHRNPFSNAYDRVVDVVAPVTVKDKLRGYLGISISVRRLVAQFNHRQAIRGSYTFLINNNQQLLAAPPHGAHELVPRHKRSLKEDIIDLSGHENAHLDEVLSRMALGKSAVEKTTITDRDKYVAYRPLRKNGWSIGVCAPLHLATIASEEMRDVIAARQKEAMNSMAVIAVLLLLCIVLVTIGIARRFTKPIKEMAKAAELVAHGRLDQRIEVGSDDEIGMLAGSFNTMTSQLSSQISAMRQQQDSLRESEARYRTLFESSPVSLWEIDLSDLRQGLQEIKSKGIEDFEDYFKQNPAQVPLLGRRMKVVDVNQATLKLHRATDKKTFFEYLPNMFENIFRQQAYMLNLVALAENRFDEFEYETATLDGKVLTVIAKSSISPGFETSWSQVFISLHNITKRVQAEKEKAELEYQLRQSQKLEAIGALAGGIAHDFNNILTAIMGYAELLLSISKEGEKQQKYSTQIFTAGKRAKDLVGQILSFSRPNKQDLEPVSVTQVAQEVCALLKATLPSTIKIEQDFVSSGIIIANPSQIHQVLMNICTNGAQAMEDGGGVLIVRVLPAENRFFKGASEQDDYLLLQVQDSGCGIPQEVIDRIFEPFFTTKASQQGSGMGLAVAHGIVRSCGGYIQVTSRENEGTVFDVYLPLAGEQNPPVSLGNAVESHQGNGETILFVDDEIALVDLAEQMLTDLGYTPVIVVSSNEALRIFREDPSAFYMVITDMTMPEMQGDLLARKMKELRGDIPILLSSGYNSSLRGLEDSYHNPDHILEKMDVDGFIKKPFTIQELSVAIRTTTEKHKAH